MFRDFCVYNGKDTKVLVVDGSQSSVGVGTDTPASQFNLKMTARTTAFRITDSNSTADCLRAGSQADGDGMLQLRTTGGAGPVLFDASGVSYITGGDFIVGGTSVGDTGSFGVQSSGAFRTVLAASTASDTLLGAISGVSNGFQINITDANAQTYKFHNGSQQSMTLNSSGQLLLGTTSSSYKFHVDSTNLAAEISIDNDTSDHKVALNTTNSVNADFNIQHKANLTSIGTGVNIPLYFHINGAVSYTHLRAHET